ncbi:MAG: NCS2 family permease [Brevinema sp.]
MIKAMDQFFKISERQSSFKKEIVGGVTTFMAMAYILAVQPSLMSGTGMPVQSIAVATAIIAGLATLFMGLYSKYPFALAPGMGPNIFFAVTLVGSGIFSWQQGLSLVFISGVLFFVLTIFGFREAISNALPTSIKLGIGAAVGIFLIYLGLNNGGLISVQNGFLSRGDFSDPRAQLTVIGILITILLHLRRIPGDLLLGILITTLIGIPMGITKLPESMISVPTSLAPVFMQFDFKGLLRVETLPFIFVFFVNDFFSTLGTLLGVSSKAKLLDKEGNLPEVEKPFLVDAVSTIGGSMVGITTVTTFVESASGVSAGARTGFASIVTGICFLLAVFFAPIMIAIPASATAPCLIIIGFMLLDGLSHSNFGVLDDTIAPFSMVTLTAFMGSIADGISIGIVAYVFVKLVKGEFKKISPLMLILSIVLLYYLIS